MSADTNTDADTRLAKMSVQCAQAISRRAIYGVVGTALGFLTLLSMDRHGFVPNPKIERA